MRLMYAALAMVYLSVYCAMTTVAQEPNLRPVIVHDPVKTAVRGQPVTVLARVTDDSGLVKSVTLFYALSKDAAPFRTVMKVSGTSMYYGTIPAEVLESADTVSYYIEATDHLDATQETDWYSMSIREVGSGGAPPPVSAAQPQQPVPPPAQERRSFSTAAIIGGGAVAVVGGALLLSGGGGGGDSGDGGSDAVQAGDYDGDVTECFTLDGSVPGCGQRAMSIRIGADGIVSSSTIREGSVLTAGLRGRNFSLVATLDPASGSTGQVIYAGTVVDDRIVGDISGDAMTSVGPGSYSGAFSARKRP